ncbi:MAG: S8 family peptidase [Candidatus Xenobia bacterium]
MNPVSPRPAMPAAVRACDPVFTQQSDKAELQRAVQPDGSLALIVQIHDTDARSEARSLVTSGVSREAVGMDLTIIDGFSVHVTPQEAPAFAQVMKRFPNAHVYHDGTLKMPEPELGRKEVCGLTAPFLDVATRTLGADRLWQRGITGQGVTIAVVDSGIAPHPDLKDKIVAFQDFVNHRSQPYDDEGHGTHVSSICAGTGAASHGRFRGLAPGASLVGIKVLDSQGNGSDSGVIAGIQWAVENRQRYNIRIINLSLGADVDKPAQDDPVAQAVAAAHAAGLIVCAAAGNTGPFHHSIQDPGYAPAAISVGAVDDKQTVDRSDDTIPYWSSRGPTPQDNLAKPDLVAPGVNIAAARANTNGYIFMSGTSMAAPMISGLSALLLQARPDARPDDVKQAMMATASKLNNFLGRPYDARTQGAGMPNALPALSHLYLPGPRARLLPPPPANVHSVWSVTNRFLPRPHVPAKLVGDAHRTRRAATCRSACPVPGDPGPGGDLPACRPARPGGRKP